VDKNLGMTSLTTRHRYRTKHDIFLQILQTIGEQGAGITKVFYGSMTSYEQCKEYLVEMTRLELITFDKDTRLYQIAPKGKHFMQLYSALRTQLGENK
jgi:predicted transcriptional regulator